MPNYSTNNSKKPVSEPKPLNEKVRKYLRCSKRLNQAYSVTELSEAAGVSRMYIQRKAEDIEAYTTTAPYPSAEDMVWFEERSIDIYLKSSASVKDVLGAVIGYLMRYQYGLLGHLHKRSKIVSVGNDVMSLIASIKSRKDTAGSPIYSQNGASRRLLEQNKIGFVDKLFIRKGGYYAGHNSKLWKTTELADQILAEAMEIVFGKLTNEHADFVPSVSSYGCYTNSHTYSSICTRLSVTLSKPNNINPNKVHKGWQIEPLVVPLEAVRQLCLSSMLHIINNSIGYANGYFIVSLNHTSKTNPMLGRSYNVFTRLRSAERKQLGFINYDISAALQVISLQLIQATKENYPLLTRYTEDKQFKRQFRDDIATSLNIPIADVKAKLTAFANGGVSGIDKHPHYKQFQEESDRLRREVLAHTAEHDPELFSQSKAQSKKQLPEDIDWFSLAPEDKQALARGKASVFFFIWTWYERLIRKAMLTVLKDGIEVHDAVYSKMDVSTDVIEAIIFESTGFKIIIDKEEGSEE